MMRNDGDGGHKNDSIWWMDIITLGFDKEKSLDQFVGNIIGTLGVGMRISFWNCKWMANQSLKESFPNLFQTFPNQKSSVADSGCWCGAVWN